MEKNVGKMFGGKGELNHQKFCETWSTGNKKLLNLLFAI